MKKVILGIVIMGLCLVCADVFAEGVDEYTVLMLHFNGEDGSQNIVDDSAANHPVTCYGNAQLDTTEKKFGGASLLLDGNGDYVTVPDSADWNFGDRDFTIDFWIKFDSLNTGDSQTFIGRYSDGNHFLEFRSDDYGVNFELRYQGIAGPVLTSAVDWAINTWYHIAVVRNGSVWNMYQNGVSVASTINSGTLDTLSATLGIGTQLLGGPTAYIDGHIDELRISKGIARWTSNFIPPTEEYYMTPNESPVANAGNDIFARAEEPIILDGSASYDPDGSIASYEWISISDPTNPVIGTGATFETIAHGYAEEIIELKVTDNRGTSSIDTLKITNPGIQGPQGEQGAPGMTPEEVAAMQTQITAIQEQNAALQQQSADQQKRLEEDRYLLQQLPQLQKKIVELESQAQ